MIRVTSFFALLGILTLMLSGCVRYYYGVHEDDWGRMSQEELRFRNQFRSPPIGGLYRFLKQGCRVQNPLRPLRMAG